MSWRLLDTARRQGFDLILLSFGDPAWQSYKVLASGLAPYFQKIVYTAKQEGKAELLDDLGLRYRELHAIDNNPADLDAMKARHPRLRTHLICRVEPSATLEANGSSAIASAKPPGISPFPPACLITVTSLAEVPLSCPE